MRNAFLTKICFFSILFSLTELAVFAQKKEKEDPVAALKKKESEAEETFTEGMKFFMLEDYDKAIPVFEKALEVAPKKAAVNFAISNTYKMKGSLEKALPFAQKAIELDKNNEAYNVALSEIYVKLGKYEEAIKIYKNLIDQNPQNSSYHIEQALVYIYQEKYPEAIKAFDKAEKQLGVTEEIIHQKQMVYLKINKIDEAILEGDKLIKEEPDETKFLLGQADLLLSVKRIDKAKVYVENALKLNPSDGKANLMMARIYQASGDDAKATDEIELALKDKNLDDATKNRLLMISINRMKGDGKSGTAAMETVQKLLNTKPNDPHTRAIYGDLLMQNKEVEKARNQYVIAAKLDPSILEVWYRIIQIDFDLKQLDSAIIHADAALEFFPNQAIFWFQSGTAYYLKRDFQKAIEGLLEAKRLVPAGAEIKQHIYAQLGDTYNEMKDYSNSDEAYDNALQENADNDHVLNNYAYYLSLRKEKLDKASEMAARLVKRNPTDGTYLDTYAWVLYMNKDYKLAKENIEKAIKNGKEQSGTIVEHYGDILYQIGEKENAVTQWKKAKTLSGGSNLLNKKIEEQKLVE